VQCALITANISSSRAARVRPHFYTPVSFPAPFSFSFGFENFWRTINAAQKTRNIHDSRALI
jgi:hypothetical protein